MTIPGDTEALLAALAGDVGRPPPGDRIPIDLTTSHARVLLGPLPLSPISIPVPSSTAPGDRGRSGRRPHSPATAGPPAQVPVPQADIDWPTVFRKAGSAEITLARAVRLAGRITVGDLRLAGWAVNGDPRTSINRLPLVICYVGSTVAATFSPDGQVLDIPIGLGKKRWPQHLWPVEAIPREMVPNQSGLPGIYLSARSRYVVIGPGTDPGLWSREGTYKLELTVTETEKKSLKAFLDRNLVLFVVNPSNWHRRSLAKALAGAPIRLAETALAALGRNYLQDALARRLAATTAADIVNETFWNVVGEITNLPLPGQLEGMIDAELRRALIKTLAIRPAAGHEDADIDVAARLLAEEIAADAPLSPTKGLRPRLRGRGADGRSGRATGHRDTSLPAGTTPDTLPRNVNRDTGPSTALTTEPSRGKEPGHGSSWRPERRAAWVHPDDAEYGHFHPLPNDVPVEHGSRSATEGEVQTSYATALRSRASENPATASAGGGKGPYIGGNLYSGSDMRRVVKQLEIHGVLEVSRGGGLARIDPERYVKWLERAYRQRGHTRLDPRMRKAIRSYVESGTSLEGRGADPRTGAESFGGRLPGTHAEIIVLNDLLLVDGAIEPAVLATVRSETGAHFIACVHCAGIIDSLSPKIRAKVTVWTGLATPVQ